MFVNDGEIIDLENGEDAVTSGQFVQLAGTGGKFVVAQEDIAADETGPAATGGVHVAPKIDGEALDQGAILFWDVDEEAVTMESDDGEEVPVAFDRVGYCWEAAAEGDLTAKVRLFKDC